MTVHEVLTRECTKGYALSIDEHISAFATQQYGVITTFQLGKCGVTGGSLAWRVRTMRLHRIHRGVYAVGHHQLTREACFMAATLACGSGASLGRMSAMSLWIKDIDAPTTPEILVARRIHRRKGISITSTRSLPTDEVTRVRRIPVSTIPRALVDLADTCTPFQLANLMHKAAFRRRLNMKKVEEISLRYPTRRGHSCLSRAIELYKSGSVGTRSKLEDEFLELIRHHGLPQPLVNTRVPTAHGTLEVDCYWPAHQLCVEIDGGGHRRPRTIRQDADRDRQLRAVNFRVIRFSGDKVQRFPKEVIAELSAELRQPQILN